MPAPKISSFNAVVVAGPLFPFSEFPAAAAVTSNGAVESSPLYSSTRTSGYAAFWLNVTETVLLPPAIFVA